MSLKKIKSLRIFFYHFSFFLLFILGFSFSIEAKVRQSSIVMNGKTGEILHQENADAHVHPASLTKMMTLFLLFEALEAKKVTLHTRVGFSKKAANQVPCKIGIPPGKSIRVYEAILALMVNSANDAAVAIAEKLDGSEDAFARRMTSKARQLGMSKTTFYNASGLHHPHQKTTARDMAILSRSLYKRFPKYYRYFSTRTFVFKGRKHHNHNRLLGVFPGIDGIKTGFVNASGFNIATSAERRGVRLFGVVMGGSSTHQRNQKVQRLLESAFHTYGRGNAHLGKEFISNKRRQEPIYLASAEESSPIIPKTKPLGSKKKESPGFTLATEIIEKDLESRAALPRSRSTWAIQVGAYRKAKEAQRQALSTLAYLKPHFSNIKTDISKARRKKRHVFRARLTGFTEQTAKRACKKMTQKGLPCLMIKPHQNGRLMTVMN